MKTSDWSQLATYVEERITALGSDLPAALPLACADLVARDDNQERLARIRSVYGDETLSAEARADLEGAAAAAGTIGMRVGPRFAKEWLAVFACTHPDPAERLRRVSRYAWDACHDDDQRATLEALLRTNLN